MNSENFTLVINEKGLPPRAVSGLLVGLRDRGLRDRLGRRLIVTAEPSNDGFYTKIVMPGEHDFKDLVGVITEINYWLDPQNVIEFGFSGKKA
jgi:hypothetical protein